MAMLFGRHWSRQELMAYLTSENQMAGIRLLEGADGRERGTRMLEVWTGSGLTFRVVADRAMDLSAVAYKGVPLNWTSATGDAHPAFYEADGLGWLRSFYGGLLTTCGLDTFGSPSQDAGDSLGQHGRISNLPAESVWYGTRWEGDEYWLEMSGLVRQSRVFGENQVLRRSLRTRLGSNQLDIHDTVTNEGNATTPHMILYHFNLGFPLISPETKVLIDAEETVPRDAEAEKGFATWSALHAPVTGYKEQVFRHRPRAGADGLSVIGVDSPLAGLRFRLRFDRAVLPHVIQWKQMGQGMYVLGLEPANSSGVEGRAKARERNDLPMLEPGQSREYRLTVTVEEIV